MLEGDLSELTSQVIRSALCETVEQKLKTKNYRIKISSASKSGTNNFMGTVYRASYRKKDDIDNEQNPEHKMIIKVAPQQSTRREQFTARLTFLQEIYMYGTVSVFHFMKKAMQNQFNSLKNKKIKSNAFEMHVHTHTHRCFHIFENLK